MDGNVPSQAVTPSGTSCGAGGLSPGDELYCRVQNPYAGSVRFLKVEKKEMCDC